MKGLRRADIIATIILLGPLFCGLAEMARFFISRSTNSNLGFWGDFGIESIFHFLGLVIAFIIGSYLLCIVPAAISAMLVAALYEKTGKLSFWLALIVGQLTMLTFFIETNFISKKPHLESVIVGFVTYYSPIFAFSSIATWLVLLRIKKIHTV